MSCSLCVDNPCYRSFVLLLKDVTENYKSVTTTALKNIAALILSGAIDEDHWAKVVMYYFMEDDHATLTLSASENKSGDDV